MDVVVTIGPTNGVRRAMAELTLRTWLQHKQAGTVGRLIAQNITGQPLLDLKGISPLIEWHGLERAGSQRQRSIHAEAHTRGAFYVLADDDALLDPRIKGRKDLGWDTYVPDLMDRLQVSACQPHQIPEFGSWPSEYVHPDLILGDRELVRDTAVGVIRFVRRGCGMDDTLPPAQADNHFDRHRNDRFQQYGRMGHLMRLRCWHLGAWHSQLRPGLRR